MKETNLSPANNSMENRNRFAAFVLSLFLPGLGQIYCGKARRGLFMLALVLVCETIAVASNLLFHFYGLLAILVCDLFVRVYAGRDAFKLSKVVCERQWYNTWFYYVLFGAGIYAILLFKSILFPVNIHTLLLPTSNMEPTMKVHDYVLADMNPSRGRLPTYGDIVAYHPNGAPVIYCCRVVALPGDTFELRKDLLVINGIPSRRVKIREFSTEPYLVDLLGAITEEDTETLPNGRTIHIYRSQNVPDSSRTRQYVPKMVIPPGRYFLLGDNRDNSADSRYEGAVPGAYIAGYICYSYWGRGLDRINVDFSRN
jgi:signal peptidase I